jgi:multiple antibiotic resistance protein
MLTQSYITLIISLIAIMNPVGNAAIFLGMTADKTRSEQNHLAWQSTIAIACILLITTWAGKGLLAFFGIQLGSFELGGGIIVALIGLNMLKGESQHDYHHNKADDKENLKSKSSIAIVPLALPMVAGPGTMTALIAGMRHMHTTMDYCILSGISIGMACLMGLCFFCAPFLGRLLGTFGLNIVTRIMGLILVAIACQMAATGIGSLLPGLMH